jgi:hypothetical protein
VPEEKALAMQYSQAVTPKMLRGREQKWAVKLLRL